MGTRCVRTEWTVQCVLELQETDDLGHLLSEASLSVEAIGYCMVGKCFGSSHKETLTVKLAGKSFKDEILVK